MAHSSSGAAARSAPTRLANVLSRQHNSPMLQVPDDLVRAILAGNCVAFVGAGFSADAVPTWSRLLRLIARHQSLKAPLRQQVEELLASNEPLSLEAAAETLKQGLGVATFQGAVASLVAATQVGSAQRQRVAWLRGVPFRGVLTTNFDGVLAGELPGPAVYRQLLRPQRSGWHRPRYWTGGAGPLVVKLHGDVTRDPSSVVLTRRDYRERLYRNGAYATFLRAVFATHTLLFLGCSFSDFYINELRSEVLALFEQRDCDTPLAYALVCDQPAARVAFFRRHEGIAVLPYVSATTPPHRHFDEFLKALYTRTNPQLHLGQRLRGRRVLWHDPNPRNNEAGIEMLRRAVALHGDSQELVEVHSVQAALAELEAAESPFDLVITHWGHQPGLSRAEELLGSMRRLPHWTPAIVFASAVHEGENRRRALRAGALAYCHGWSMLFRLLAQVFEDDRVASVYPD